MLIAQAQIEAVTQASVDTRFPAYEVQLLSLA
jgi:PIN domain nuclease of toxin-antitoxin system